MLSVKDALQLVLEQAGALPAVEIPAADALGRVLAETINSDVDSPPHDKSMVDGFAVICADLAAGPTDLQVIDEVVAGDVPRKALARGQATRIMTGAPIPQGADAVVMVERTRPAANPSDVRIDDHTLKPGYNILPRACSMRRGDEVLQPGAPLRPIELGLLAEVGRTRVRVVRQPVVAVLSTGNELIPPAQTPTAGMIRNSNGPMLAASIRNADAAALELGIARDDRGVLRQAIARGLAADVLVLSGGVSAGILDLVPGVLAELGVEQVFHKVQLKPGKPLWFGVLKASATKDSTTLVFGLPGNPVSSLVCFELFVRPAIERLSGRMEIDRTLSAVLSGEFAHRGDRPTYQPARLEANAGSPRVAPLRWQGSADLRTLAQANALIRFSAGDRNYLAGECVTVHRL